MLKEQIDKARVESKTLLLNKTLQEVKHIIVISNIYNRVLSNIKSIVQNYWYALQIDPDFKEVFQYLPLIAFGKTTNLK